MSTSTTGGTSGDWWLASIALAVIIFVTCFTGLGCAARYERPANPNYQKIGKLWYCFGPQIAINPGQTWDETLKRVDPCDPVSVDSSRLIEFQP